MGSADGTSSDAGTLVVDSVALRAAQSQVNGIAEALIEKLRKTGADVDGMLETWHGGAAVKWAGGWAEAHDSSLELFNILGALSDALGGAAMDYDDQEGENRTSLADVQQTIKINW